MKPNAAMAAHTTTVEHSSTRLRVGLPLSCPRSHNASRSSLTSQQCHQDADRLTRSHVHLPRKASPLSLSHRSCLGPLVNPSNLRSFPSPPHPAPSLKAVPASYMHMVPRDSVRSAEIRLESGRGSIEPAIPSSHRIQNTRAVASRHSPPLCLG